MNNLIKRHKENGHQKEQQGYFPSPFNSFFENVFSNESLFSKVPSVNIYETDQNFVLEFSAPGFKKENFSIELENDVLSISGTTKEEKHEEKRSYTRREFGMSSFKRSFTIPETVDANRIDAHYEDGLLKITMSKRDEARPKPPRTIQIS